LAMTTRPLTGRRVVVSLIAGISGVPPPERSQQAHPPLSPAARLHFTAAPLATRRQPAALSAHLGGAIVGVALALSHIEVADMSGRRNLRGDSPDPLSREMVDQHDAGEGLPGLAT
jgi:hypothetical protein